MNQNGKSRRIIIIICILTGVCLAGAAVLAVVLSKRNPLEKGLRGLAKEIEARNEEMGEHFWADAINRIGSGNMQAQYSVNIGGIEELQNITLGLDGEVKRDMERKLLNSEVSLSVANAKITEASFFGTEDTLYLQVPSVWEGSVVVDAEDIGGQWNGSAAKAGLEQLTGRDLDIDRRIDIRLFDEYYVNPSQDEDTFEKNREKWRSVYHNMEVMKVGKALKKGLLDTDQAQSLENYVLEDAGGEKIMTTCYLVILPEKELKEIYTDLEGDIRLCVYLDAAKRIVRAGTLPGEALETDIWEGGISINMTGAEAAIDRIELETAGTTDVDALLSVLSGEEGVTAGYGGLQELTELFDGSEIKSTIIIEKNREAHGSYQVEYDAFLTDSGENEWELFLESGVQGERLDEGEKLSLDVERLVVKSQEQVICRGSGTMRFEPLKEEIKEPTGKQRRVGEMNAVETALFLAECVGNISKNYSGYLSMLR